MLHVPYEFGVAWAILFAVAFLGYVVFNMAYDETSPSWETQPDFVICGKVICLVLMLGSVAIQLWPFVLGVVGIGGTLCGLAWAVRRLGTRSLQKKKATADAAGA